MTKFMFTAVALVAAAVSSVQAAGGCKGPGCNNGRHGNKPVFQAAPWYLYWPYNAHFQTPAPLTGPYYAPPSSGATLTSPYFPAQPVQPQYGNPR